MKIELKEIMWSSFLLGYKTHKGSHKLTKKELQHAKEKFKEVLEFIK